MYSSSDDDSSVIEYSSSDVSRDGSEGKKRSFLQQPRSYSKLPAPATNRRELSTDVGVPKTQPIPIPPQGAVTNTAPEQIDAPEFFIGDRVCIGGIKTGTLLYFGTIHVAPGSWCGISLDEPDGIHDGLVNDVRYFTCRKGHGIFAPVEKVKHLDIKTTLNTVCHIVKAPSRVSPISSKSKVCQNDPLDTEFELREFNNKCELELDDELEGLDENGILHDSDLDDDDDNKSGSVRRVPRRKLPKVPRANSQGLSRVQYMKMESTGDTSELDEAAERLKMLSEEEGLVKDINEVLDLPPSTAGSSGGEDSWSLSKDYLAMCDGNQSYLNITFDGDPESKASTHSQEASSKEPSEESPSPEFIFDQEMMEDGEFSSQPLEMSRDSSLGLLSSLALEKTDLMFELGDGLDDIYIDNLGSQDTLEPNSQEKMPTPERQQNLNCSLEFDENDVECSTPFTDKTAPSILQMDNNGTFVKDNSSQLTEKVNLHSTFTKEEGHLISEEIGNGTFTKDSVQQNLNSTFCLSDKTETQQNLNSTFCLSEKPETHIINEVVANVKVNDNAKKEMMDSGISLRGSMTESAISTNSLRGSMMDSTSIRGSMIDQLGHGVAGQTSVHLQGVNHNGGGIDSSNDSANVVNGVMVDPNMVKGEVVDPSALNGVLVRDGGLVQPVVEGTDTSLGKEEVIHAELDDKQLISDLRHGHQKRQRPISYVSTTSADTGYVPDTDSEVGTLTLNSPQEWMDKGFHGNQDHPLDLHGRSSAGLDRNGERMTMLEPVPIESDSDVGTMTCDTDNETDRAEIVHPVEACETRLSGVVLDEIVEGDLSDDDITQSGDIPDNKANTTITLENVGEKEMEDRPDTNLDSTFTLPVSEASDNTNNSGNGGDSCETTESLSIVTVVIADADEEEKKKDIQTDNKKENKEKQKTPKKKKFNVVKDFKKPNTNVVSKLSEYFKAPPPPKPVKEDKSNTEEAKNKRNSLKGKIDLSKVTSKIANKVVDNKVTEDKNVGKEVKEIIEKEPVKKVKRTPPKSKWDSIMNQISDQKPKPVTEVKSKLESIIHAPAPVKKFEDVAPKPKRRISMGIPDYSKVQSKLSYSALPRLSDNKSEDSVQKSKSDTSTAKKSTESPNRSKHQSPARDKSDSPKANLKDKLRRKSSAVLKTTEGHSRSVDNSPNRSRRPSEKGDRRRNMSGESPKRPGIKDKMAHIDLGESLDGRGSRTGTGSVWSSRQSSVTDMSTTGVEDESQAGLHRAMSEELVRRNSVNVDTESQASVDTDSKVQKGEINKQRRKSSLVAPKNLLDTTLGDGIKNKGGPKIVKPVIRQHSAPAPLTGSRNRSPALSPPSKLIGEKKTKRHRSRYQNRNKKPKKDEKPKPPETVLAEVHNREVQRLEALCESRTKQLTYAKLQMQTCEKAFDGMAVMANHLAHNLDAFACPSLKTHVSLLEKKAVVDKNQIESLEETRANQEDIIGRMKEEHRAYVNNLEAESEKSLLYQREYLTGQHQHDIERMQEKKNTAIFELRKSHEEYIEQKRQEHLSLVEQLKQQHREDISSLQRKQEFQMEELHKQHQDKLEEITNRFDGIKCTLSDKVDCLKSECDRLRDRAKHCEEALQRDSDFKVQCALAPYKNLPQEIESLKLVVEMRNEEINKLRNQNAELHKKLEELPIAQEKIIALQQKKENLEAIISMKTDHEKTLHERCQNLMKKYDKESRANKRLSMEYEELMYKLNESFSETEEMSQQEAAFYKKLGMSPTNDIPGSPGVTRRLRSTSSCESSPSKSPHYRRPVSAIFDDRGREDKKLHRRSGNFLIDERRKTQQRSTSPLAKENPLTRSWSPSTQTPTSPSISSDKSKNRLSQSWCVDVFDDDTNMDVDRMIDVPEDKPKQIELRDDLQNTGELTIKSPVTDSNITSDIDKETDTDINSVNSVTSVEQLNRNSVELHQAERVRQTDTPTKPKDNIAGLVSEVQSVVTADSLERPNESDSHTNSGNVRPSSGVESAVLSTATVKCPPSKIPTNVTAEKRETKIPTRSHRESAV